MRSTCTSVEFLSELYLAFELGAPFLEIFHVTCFLCLVSRFRYMLDLAKFDKFILQHSGTPYEFMEGQNQSKKATWTARKKITFSQAKSCRCLLFILISLTGVNLMHKIKSCSSSIKLQYLINSYFLLTAAGTHWKSGKRQSTRIRTRPLEYWKGERFLYGRVHESKYFFFPLLVYSIALFN